MLKIVVDESREPGPVLRLEGQLIGPWVEELGRVSVPLLDRPRPLHLDLRSGSFVSREGADLLRGLRDRDARLLHCSPFVAEQLKRRADEGGNGR